MTSRPDRTPDADEVLALRRRCRELESWLEMCGCPPAPSAGAEDTPPAAPSDATPPLVALVSELTRADSFDELSHRAVELGHRVLGFERLGLWFTTEQPWEIEGSFGIDETGKLRDERGVRVSVRPGSLGGLVLGQRKPLAMVEDVDLRDHHARPVGRGEHAAAALWNGEEVIGLLSTDNLLSGEPISEDRKELLRSYASALGHLCSLKRAEETLRATGVVYQTLVENLDVGVFRNTPEPDGRFLQANMALARMHGYDTVAEFLSTHVSEHYVDPAQRVELLAELRRHGSVHDREIELRRRDGSVFWGSVTATAHGDETGNVLWYDGILEDVTERKQAQASLQRAMDHLRDLESIVNRSPAMVFLWRAEEGWPVEFVSDNIVQLGYTVEDLTSGRVSWPGITHPEDAPRLEEEVAAYVRDGVDEFQQEYRLLAADGTVRWVEDRNRVIRDAKGQITHVQGIVLDVTARRTAQDALRESEEKYRTLVESAGEAICTMDAEGRYLFANTTAAERLGITVDELVGKTMWDFFPPEVADRQFGSVRHVIETGQGSVGETLTFVRGEKRWYQTSLAPLRDQRGTPAAALIIARDVTERRQAEEALRESEEKYRTLVESAGEAICTLDADGRYLLANSTVGRQLGLPVDEIVGRPLHDFFPSETADQHVRTVRNVLLTNQPFVHETITSIQGEPRWYQASLAPVCDSSGRPVSVLIVARDITEQKQAEVALRQSELLYRTTIDAMADAIHVVNADLRITLCNRQFTQWCARLGVPAPHIGQRVHEAFPFLPKDIRGEYETVFRSGDISVTEETTALAGRAVITETHKIPVHEAGRVARVITVIRDITERKEQEARIRAAHGKLVTAREAERRRLAGDLHDSIGQKLVALQLALQTASLAPDLADPAGLREQLARLSAGCRDLVREVRMLCHGLYPPALENFGLVSALEHVLDQIRSAGATAIIDCPDDLPERRFGAEIEIAAYRIAQEASNNALRHGGAGRITFHLRCEKGELTLCVEDDGCGYEVDRPNHRGLGLTMMHERAAAVGGAVSAESQPGRTCVHFRVPLAGRAGQGLADARADE